MKRMICFSICLVLLTACGNNAKPSDSSELLQHLRFHGTEFSYPCTFGEISGQFGLTNENIMSFESNSFLYYDLTYHDESVATIGFSGEKTDHLESMEIEMLEITGDQLSAFKLGDTICNADYKALTKALGKPDSQMETGTSELGTSKVITYNWNGVDLSIIFHDNQAHQLTFVKR